MMTDFAGTDQLTLSDRKKVVVIPGGYLVDSRGLCWCEPHSLASHNSSADVMELALLWFPPASLSKEL